MIIGTCDVCGHYGELKRLDPWNETVHICQHCHDGAVVYAARQAHQVLLIKNAQKIGYRPESSDGH